MTSKTEKDAVKPDTWTPIGMAAWRVLKEVNRKRKESKKRYAA